MSPRSAPGLRRAVALGAAVAMFAVPAPWGVLVAGAVLLWRGGPVLRRLVAVGRRARARRPAPAADAVALGRDPQGRAVALTGEQLGAHALVVGASGAGKSTTLQTILADRIARGAPVVVIDMKGSPSFARGLGLAAHRAGRTLRVWTPEGPTHWNPLAHGGPTALKDRLIAAERFSEPHYRRAAERYLQSALQVLAATHPDRPPALGELVAALEPATLRRLAAGVAAPLGPRVGAYAESLTPDQLSAARGLGTRLALLAESDAGPWLNPPPADRRTPVLDLGDALSTPGGAPGPVVLISINSSVYGGLGAQLGALAVADLTSAAGRRLGETAGRAGAGGIPAATVAIDEFSALGGDTVLALLARGRESGVGVLLATQELADLERAGRGFRDQVLGITAVTLAHRQEVHESALAISRMAGTRTAWRDTGVSRGGGRGGGPRVTRTLREEPIVHPNAIKRLGTGELVLLSGVPEPVAARVRVTPPGAAAPGRRWRPGRRIASADRGDQAAPGITR